jgi:HK97 family phage portal protein
MGLFDTRAVSGKRHRRKAPRGGGPRQKSRSYTDVDFFGARMQDSGTLAIVEEGYKQNPYVYRAVMLLARGVASLDITVYEGREEMSRREDHPAARLLQRPNPLAGKATFFEHLVTRLLLAGRVFPEAIRPDTGPPRELYVPESSDIEPIFSRDADGLIERYRSHEAGETWTPEEMHMIRLINPANPLAGQSLVQAAGRVVDMSNYGRKYAHSLLKAMGVPPYLLTTEGRLSDEGKANFREDFAEGVRESFRQMQEAGVTRPKVYDQMENTDFQRLGFSPDEMSLLDLMQQAGREIAVAMGPAPELLGDPENKVYNNVSEAREALYTEHVMPLGRLIAGELTTWLGEQFDFGDDLFFGFDKKQIDALQVDPQEQRRLDMEELKAGAITVNEYRERQGLEPVDGGDVLLLPSNSTPTATSIDAMPEPQPNGSA